MKSSAWYHKLWRKKLEKLSFPGNVRDEWATMSRLLDESGPVGAPAEERRRILPFVLKVASLLLYALPAAAIVLTATYLVSTHIVEMKKHTKHAALYHSHPKQNTGIKTILDSLPNAASAGAAKFPIKSPLASGSIPGVSGKPVQPSTIALSAVHQALSVHQHIAVVVINPSASQFSGTGNQSVKVKAIKGSLLQLIVPNQLSGNPGPVPDSGKSTGQTPGTASNHHQQKGNKTSNSGQKSGQKQNNPHIIQAKG